ncbi:MAG: serine/threonine-protein kinase Nek [archaeon]|nr:serine/threonine-protein kinase Nek [archaeon]
MSHIQKAVKNSKYSKDQFIGQYKIIKKIGKGSYANIYKVQKINSNDIYVLKEILINGDEDEETLKQIKSESTLLSQLNSNYIIKYYDSFTSPKTINIITEYCENGDLDAYIKKHIKEKKRINEKTIWKFFVQICLGLYHLHSKNILHRDIKSKNIFLNKNNDAKIGDLGIAKKLIDTSYAHTFIGTPYYLSPELCKDLPYDEKSDVWALGCIIYEMAALCHPFDSSSQLGLYKKIISENYEEIDDVYSPQLKKMINLLLQKDMSKRPKMRQVIKMNFFISLAKQLNISIENEQKHSEIKIEVNEPKEESNMQNTIKTNNSEKDSIKAANTKQSQKSEIINLKAIKNIKISPIEINFQNKKRNIKLKNNNPASSADRKKLGNDPVKLKNSSSDPKFLITRNSKQSYIENNSKKFFKSKGFESFNSSRIQNKNQTKKTSVNVSGIIKECKNETTTKENKVLPQNQKINDNNKNKPKKQLTINSYIAVANANKKNINPSGYINNKFKIKKDIKPIIKQAQIISNQNSKNKGSNLIESKLLNANEKKIVLKNSFFTNKDKNPSQSQTIDVNNDNQILSPLNINHNENNSSNLNNEVKESSDNQPIIKYVFYKEFKNNNANLNKGGSQISPDSILSKSFTLGLDTAVMFNKDGKIKNNCLDESSSEENFEIECVNVIGKDNQIIKKTEEEKTKEKEDLSVFIEKYKTKQKEYLQEMNIISEELTSKIIDIYNKTDENINNSTNSKTNEDTLIFERIEDMIKESLNEEQTENYGKNFYNYVLNDFKLKQAMNLMKNDI